MKLVHWIGAGQAILGQARGVYSFRKLLFVVPNFWKLLGQNWHVYIFFWKGICGKFLLLEWKKSQTNKWKKEQIDTPRCMLTTRHTGQCLRLTVEKDMAWHDMLKLNVKCYSWMAWHDMTWHDTIYMTWHDMTWHDWQLKNMADGWILSFYCNNQS